jgi:hypothetical protein
VSPAANEVDRANHLPTLSRVGSGGGCSGYHGSRAQRCQEHAKSEHEVRLSFDMGSGEKTHPWAQT